MKSILAIVMLLTPFSVAHAQNYQLPESYYNSQPGSQQPTTVQTESISQTHPTTEASEPKISEPGTANTIKSTMTVAQADTKQESDDNSALYENNPAILRSRLGNLESEFDEMKKGKYGEKTAGYNGGFYIRDPDGDFKLKINGRLQMRYAYIAAEDFDDGHNFSLRRAYMAFSGNTYGQKINYYLLLSLTASNPRIYFDLGYTFNDWFGIHATQDSHALIGEVGDSSGKLTFISKSLVGNRYDIGGSLGLYVTGGNSKFGYELKIFNGIDTGYGANTNNELGYSGRVVYNPFVKMSSGQADYAFSEKPAMSIGGGAIFGHYDTATQARLFLSALDMRFKYKGFAFYTAGVFRQTDLDRFTRAQNDFGAVAQASYFLVPKTIEVGLRASALFDDTTNAGLNIGMYAGNITRIKGYLSGGDIDEDSDNEYEFSGALNYYVNGYNLKIQAQYSMIIDGILGPDDRTNHVGLVQAMMGF